MASTPDISWVPFNFLALTPEQSDLRKARAVVLPVPYDSTTSYRTGSRYGPMAIIQASGTLEDYDQELDLDVASLGIHTTPFLEPHMAGPAQMVERIQHVVQQYASTGKIVAVLGGEHTVTVGAVRAMASLYEDLSVLYLDAHGDLRASYMDTPYSHATAARRVREMCPVVQVGVRSISLEERDFIKKGGAATFFWDAQSPSLPKINDVLKHLSPTVYVSVDLDSLDPSIMSAVGTPEPGGMTWAHMTGLLKDVARQRRIVGFDVTELSPEEGPNACSYTAAKLVYKLIAYSATLGPDKAKTSKG
ncbi:MAG: agmatinase [SAR202 cluster bacterium]|nr:agmatinase [SAR202 cluster bacterium]